MWEGLGSCCSFVVNMPLSYVVMVKLALFSKFKMFKLKT
jgi:hypothetical protein